MGSFSCVKKTEISVQHDKPQISETLLSMQIFTYQNPQFLSPSELKAYLLAWRATQALGFHAKQLEKKELLPRPAMLLQEKSQWKSQRWLMKDWWEKQMATPVPIIGLTIHKFQCCWNRWPNIQKRILVLRWHHLLILIINVRSSPLCLIQVLQI